MQVFDSALASTTKDPLPSRIYIIGERFVNELKRINVVRISYFYHSEREHFVNLNIE